VTPRSHRLSIVAIAVTPILVTVVVALRLLGGPAPSTNLACPVLPNGVVPFLADLEPDCPLSAFDRIEQLESEGRVVYLRSLEDLQRAVQSAESVRVKVRRGSGTAWLTVPVIRESSRWRTLRLGAAGCVHCEMGGAPQLANAVTRSPIKPKEDGS